MASKLADILKQEYKTKGLFSGTSSAIGKSMREKLDIRNALFGGSGLGSVIGRKLFGKGYSALGSDKSKVSDASNDLSSASTTVLQEINLNSQISAKNSMSLPMMARDMNVMRQNIVKMVKAQNIKPATKADTFFMRAGEREKAYEAQFNKKSPSKVSVEGKEKGSGLFGIIGGILGALGGVIGAVAGSLGSLTGIISTAIGALALFGKSIFKMFAFLAKTKIGKIIGLGGLLLGSKYAFAGNDAGGETNLQNPESPITEQPTENASNISGGTLAAGGLAAYGATKFATKATGLMRETGASISNTKTLGDTSAFNKRNRKQTMKVLTQDWKSGKLTKWGRFLKFVEKRAPKLWAKIGVRLAQAGMLATIPIAGWIAAAINLGFTLWTAYEIYTLWKEFMGENEDSTSPTQVKDDMRFQFDDNGVFSGVTSASNPTSPTPAGGGYGGKIEPVPEKNDIADLIRKKFKEAGFNDAQAEAAVANAWAESRLNPNAHNTNGEDSVGLFQMNRNGGLGQGHSVEDLKNPAYNIDLAIAAAKKSKAFTSATNVSDAITAFVNDVERPADKAGAIQSRIASVQNTKDIGNKATQVASNETGAAFGVRMKGVKLNEASKEVAANKETPTQVTVNKTDVNNVQNGQGSGQQVAVVSPTAFDSELSKFLLRPMAL